MSFCPARSLSYQHVQNAPFRSRPPDTLGLQYHSAAATVGLDQLDHPQARIGSELLHHMHMLHCGFDSLTLVLGLGLTLTQKFKTLTECSPETRPYLLACAS